MDSVVDHWDKIMTIFFAGLSAVFAGLSFLVLFLEYKRNNPKVDVKMIRGTGKTKHPGIFFIRITVINKGRRPIELLQYTFHFEENFVFSLKKNTYLDGLPKFPIVLNEMEKVEFDIKMDDFIREIRDFGKKIKHIAFMDSLWNQHKYKIKEKEWKEFF